MISAGASERILLWEKIYYCVVWVLDYVFYLGCKALIAISYIGIRGWRKVSRLRRSTAQPESPFNRLKQQGHTKKTLLLDLDGTLVYTSGAESTESIKIYVNGKYYYVKQRPHLGMFIRETQKVYDLGVYTASMQNYADEVIRVLGLEKDIPKHMRFYRNSCDFVNGNYMKRVSKVEADLRNVVILDNRPEIIRDRRNIVKIESWTGGNDEELLKCLEQLKIMSRCDDVRRFVF
jgi:Dullard-like phosphatase family protein